MELGTIWIKKITIRSIQIKIKKYLSFNYKWFHYSKLIEIDKISSLIYTQRIQINMKNWHAQQLDMSNFWVAAWLDDREVFCSFLFFFYCIYLCPKDFVYCFEWNEIKQIWKEINHLKSFFWVGCGSPKVYTHAKIQQN